MDLFNNNNLGCSVDVQAQSVSDTPSASLSFSKPTSQVTDKSSKKLSTDVQAGPHTAGNVIPFSETSQPTAVCSLEFLGGAIVVSAMISFFSFVTDQAYRQCDHSYSLQ